MIDYDKLIDKLMWKKESPSRYKGRFQAYSAEVSPYGLVVYRWDTVVHHIQDRHSDYVYNKVKDMVYQRTQKEQREFTAAFHDYFGKD